LFAPQQKTVQTTKQLKQAYHHVKALSAEEKLKQEQLVKKIMTEFDAPTSLANRGLEKIKEIEDKIAHGQVRLLESRHNCLTLPFPA
jgi:hypothetical protein